MRGDQTLEAETMISKYRSALGAFVSLMVMATVFHTTELKAQWSDEHRASHESTERFFLEVGGGPYTPDIDSTFGDAFNTIYSDAGPQLRLEFDAIIWRIPYVGPLGAGLGIGWIEFDAQACEDPPCSGTTDDETKLSIVPLSFFALLRIDTLARQLSIPFVFTGKLGLDAIHYDASTSGTSQSKGFSVGLRWAAQAALELDFLQPRMARSLDEDWGINHTYLFFELFGSTASNGTPVGTKLGMWFGLGFHM